MQIRRFKDIVAVKSDTNSVENGHIVAFHATNMEVAEITPEAFNEMSDINLRQGGIPPIESAKNEEAFSQILGWNDSINMDAKKGPINFGIRSVTININQICNLHCAYCAAGGDGSYGEPTTQISIEKTLPQLNHFIKKLSPGSKFSVTFVGGEPLLHPRAVLAIYEYVTSKCAEAGVRFSISLVTNGTLITEETAKLLREMQIHITISLDGKK